MIRVRLERFLQFSERIIEFSSTWYDYFVSGKVFQNRIRYVPILAISKAALQDLKTPVSFFQNQSNIDSGMRVRHYSQPYTSRICNA